MVVLWVLLTSIEFNVMFFLRILLKLLKIWDTILINLETDLLIFSSPVEPAPRRTADEMTVEDLRGIYPASFPLQVVAVCFGTRCDWQDL